MLEIAASYHSPRNKGRLIGQKPPLKLQEVWSIRIKLEIAKRARYLAMFNLAIDSKLRSCDLVKLKAIDVAHGSNMLNRAMVIQQKTQRAVQLLLRHIKLESTARHLGIEVDDALEMAEQTKV